MTQQPKTVFQKRLKETRRKSGLVECILWVTPPKKEQLMIEYPPPTLADLTPAKDYIEEIK